MKKILGLVAVFAALLAFVYFYEIQGEEGRTQEKQRAESLLRLETSEISRVAISRQGKGDILLTREGETWRIESPVTAEADAGTVQGLLSALTAARRERDFQDVTDLKDFGLASPAVRLRVSGSKGEVALSLGSKDFSGNSLYVQLDGPEVFLTEASLLSAIEKEPFDWRSKKVLAFSRDEVESIEINRPQDHVLLQRQNGKWQLTAPLADAAQESTVESLLTVLDSAQAAGFAAEAPEALGDFGLDRPALSLALKLKGRDEPARLDIGHPAKEGDTWFARDRSRSPVFRVRKELLDALEQAPIAFRNKDVIEVRQEQVKWLRFSHGDFAVQVRREEFRWLVDEPAAQKDQEVPAYRFWYPLSDLKYVTLADAPADLPAVEATVQIGLEDGSTVAYEFGRRGAECRARSRETGRSGALSCTDLDQILGWKLDALVQQ